MICLPIKPSNALCFDCLHKRSDHSYCFKSSLCLHLCLDGIKRMPNSYACSSIEDTNLNMRKNIDLVSSFLVYCVYFLGTEPKKYYRVYFQSKPSIHSVLFTILLMANKNIIHKSVHKCVVLELFPLRDDKNSRYRYI